MMNNPHTMRQTATLPTSVRLIALLLFFLAGVALAELNGGEDALKIQYKTDASRYVELQHDRLPPPHRQMFDSVVPLMYAVDRKFQFALRPKEAAPEIFVPTMTWFEGKERDEDNIKWDGRTIRESELRYVDGQWQHIFYKERSYDVLEEKIYSTQADAVYSILSNFVQVRASKIVFKDPAFQIKYDEKYEELEKHLKEGGVEPTPKDGIEAPIFWRYHKFQLALKMMEAVKPEWVERLKVEAKEQGIDLGILEKLEPLTAAAKAAYKDTN